MLDHDDIQQLKLVIKKKSEARPTTPTRRALEKFMVQKCFAARDNDDGLLNSILQTKRVS